MDKTFIKEIRAGLINSVERLKADNPEIILVSLCTTDGFNIRSFSNSELAIEADKIAAISSTICALSGSVAKQLSQEKFNTTIIETHSDNILFVGTEYLGAKCVLTVAAKPKMSLATARFCTRRLADAIKKMG